MSYSLILIDMQPYFQAATNRRVLTNCKRELADAINVRAGIIFVEYEGCGLTSKALCRLTQNYDRTFTVSKGTDDGSREVHNLILDHNLAAKRLRVCGVNTDCCVLATVRGLTARMPRSTIEVIGDACNSDYEHAAGLSNMKRFKNVSIKG